MANRTLRGSLNVHGTNPQFLVEKTIRLRIYDSRFWKEHCFALTAASLVDRALELEYIGGTYGLGRPSPFLCLVQKLLQLQPERAIVLEYLDAEEFKYLRALAAMYIRLTFRSVDVYELLEPLLDDYRKLRWRDMTGTYSLTHMDDFIDRLLTEERVCDIILPRLTRRDVLEETDGLAPRVSKLEGVLLHGTAGLATEAREEDAGAESDDSTAEARRELQRRKERASKVREARLQREKEAEERRKELLALREEEEGRGDAEEGEEEGYASQELSDAEGEAQELLRLMEEEDAARRAVEDEEQSNGLSTAAGDGAGDEGRPASPMDEGDEQQRQLS